MYFILARFTLSLLGKIFSKLSSKFFFLFPHRTREDLAFLANCLHEMSNPVFWENETICMKCQSYYLRKIRKNLINLSSPDFYLS